MMSGFVQNGHYNEAIELFRQMEAAGQEPDAVILRSLVDAYSNLGVLQWASRIYGDRKLGEYVAQRVMELEPDNAGYYTLLCNIQASAGQWIEVEEVRRAMNEKNLKTKPAWSCIQEKGKISGFVSGNV
ncbi:hypothetical protein Q3G72_018728 [Acer saccharum]|nr:hypothetical protein Q3G72_018728 [Acer saccharum]